MQRRKFFVFFIIMILVVSVSSAFYSVLALETPEETYGPPTPPPYSVPTLSLWWEEKDCGFSRPDFIIWKHGLRVLYDWSTEPDISPFGFEVIKDDWGVHKGVSLSMVYTGAFKGGSDYMYTFLFDLYLTNTIGLEERIYPARNFYLDIVPFCDYDANPILIEEDSLIYTFNDENVTMTWEMDRIHFEVTNAIENHYRVQVYLFAMNKVDFNMIGIMVQNFYQTGYGSVDGVFSTPNLDNYDSFVGANDSVVDSSQSGLSLALNSFNFLFDMPSYFRLSLLSVKAIIDRLLLYNPVFSSVISFSLAIGVIASVLAIAHTVSNSLKSRGGKE